VELIKLNLLRSLQLNELIPRGGKLPYYPILRAWIISAPNFTVDPQLLPWQLPMTLEGPRPQISPCFSFLIWEGMWSNQWVITKGNQDHRGRVVQSGWNLFQFYRPNWGLGGYLKEVHDFPPRVHHLGRAHCQLQLDLCPFLSFIPSSSPFSA
jgi:hypothetical protein